MKLQEKTLTRATIRFTYYQKEITKMSGPKVDGTGQEKMKESMPKDTVDSDARTDVPGGESKKGSQVQVTGPNSYKK